MAIAPPQNSFNCMYQYLQRVAAQLRENFGNLFL